MTKIINKLRKILELANRGIDGEQTNASKLLIRLLQKYNITIEELNENVKKTNHYKYTNSETFIILKQILFYVLNVHTITYYKNTKELEADVTEYEHIQISELKEFHFKQYRKERKKIIEAMTVAYIHKHKLYGPDYAPTNEKEITKEDMEKEIRISYLKNTMENITLIKKLKSNETPSTMERTKLKN